MGRGILFFCGFVVVALLLLAGLAPSAPIAGEGISDSISDIKNGDWTIIEPPTQPAYWAQWGYSSEAEALAALEQIDVFALEEQMFEATTAGTLNLPYGWDYGTLNIPPSGAINDLLRPDHHAKTTHPLMAPCIAHVTQMGLTPVRVYFSTGVPNTKEDYPSLGFMWHLDKVLRDIEATPGACLGMPGILQQEYGRVPKYTDVKLFMVVKLDPTKGWVTISAYPVLLDLLNAQLCEHHYYWQLYPGIKEVKCMKGF
jgi:hypothetical protein